MKIAIVTDSACGISQAEAKSMGIYVVPMAFYIDGQMVYEDIDITRDDFFTRIADGADVTTSQPLPEDVMKVWDQALEEHDAIVHIPLTSGLSGTTQEALLLSREDEYEGKVFVTDNHRVSVTQRASIDDALQMIAAGMEPAAIVDKLNTVADDNSIYIALHTLEFLKKGGRITPAAAAFGSLLRIKPVLSIMKGGHLDSYRKGRSDKQCRSIIVDALRQDCIDKFHDPEARNLRFSVAYSDDPEGAAALAEEIKAAFPNRGLEVVNTDPLSLLLCCHIGPGGVGACVTPIYQ